MLYEVITHTMALKRGGRIGAAMYYAKAYYGFEIIGNKEWWRRGSAVAVRSLPHARACRGRGLHDRAVLPPPGADRGEPDGAAGSYNFV